MIFIHSHNVLMFRYQLMYSLIPLTYQIVKTDLNDSGDKELNLLG